MTCTTGQAYGEASYWDKRYAGEGGGSNFDWYQKYHSLSPLLHLYLPPSSFTRLLVVGCGNSGNIHDISKSSMVRFSNSLPPSSHFRILVVGCGNSAFSEGMVDDGYEDVVSIDISSVVIQAMQTKYANRPQLKYLTMDVCDMSAFQTASFDAVIDKGTLDSLLCGGDSKVNATKMLEEVGRVLKDKGVYILITYGAPNYRLYLLRESVQWTVKLHVIGRTLGEESSEHNNWDLTSPVPLNANDGNSTEAAIGNNMDVHYIYVCIKDDSSKLDLEPEAPQD